MQATNNLLSDFQQCCRNLSLVRSGWPIPVGNILRALIVKFHLWVFCPVIDSNVANIMVIDPRRKPRTVRKLLSKRS